MSVFHTGSGRLSQWLRKLPPLPSFHPRSPSGEDGAEDEAPESAGGAFEAQELSFQKDDMGVSFESGVFLNSLDELSESDIPLSEAAAKAGNLSFFEVIRRMVFWISLIVFIVSCFLLVQNLIDKRRAVQIYDQLESEFFSAGFSFDASTAFHPEEGEVKYLSMDTEQRTMVSMTDTLNGIEQEEETALPEIKTYNQELEKMRAGLASLAQINPDIYGWIMVDNTNISYPLVQGTDNAYYLNHAYTGDFLPNGSIFVDYRCNKSITKNFNTVMYGHNIMDGGMFHDLQKFSKEDFFNGDNYIYIYTMDGIYVYEVFSFYKTRADYNYFRTAFSSADFFIQFADQMRDNSSVEKDKEIAFTGKDRVLTLSTCTNIAMADRYALHARLIKTILK